MRKNLDNTASKPAWLDREPIYSAVRAKGAGESTLRALALLSDPELASFAFWVSELADAGERMWGQCEPELNVALDALPPEHLEAIAHFVCLVMFRRSDPELARAIAFLRPSTRPAEPV